MAASARTLTLPSPSGRGQDEGAIGDRALSLWERVAEGRVRAGFVVFIFIGRIVVYASGDK
jgi:hypothetical protein